MISKYTSYDEVRSVLGVEDDELSDSTLALGVYYNHLLEALGDVNPLVVSLFDEVGELPDKTPTQERFLRLVRTFSTYAVAKQFTTSLPMFAPRSIGDGKATMSRFPNPYKETIEGIEEQFTLTQNRLQQVVDELTSENRGVEPRRFFIGVGLAQDPVTGV